MKKTINAILRFLRIKKEEIVSPLSQASLDELIVKFNETRNEIIELSGTINDRNQYISKINELITGKLTQVKKGDIIQAHRKNNVNSTFLVNYVLYNPDIVSPIPQIVLGCKTWTSAGHSIRTNLSDITIGYKASKDDKSADPLTITSIKVLRNVYDTAKAIDDLKKTEAVKAVNVRAGKTRRF